MKYPPRFKANIGDIVYAVTVDENDNICVNKVTIDEIQDNSYHVKVDKNGYFTDEVVRSDDHENYSIGYWVKELSIGSALYFGENLFLTEAEALDDVMLAEEENKRDIG